MGKYYLIPVVEKNVYIELSNYSLYDLLKLKYKVLIDMENKRIDMIYRPPMTRSFNDEERYEYENHKKLQQEKYDLMKVPRFLIAKGDEYECKEVITGVNLKTNSTICLQIRQIDKTKAINYLKNNLNYSENVKSFLNNQDICNIKILHEKKLQEDLFYIKGTVISGKKKVDIEGYFQGEVERVTKNKTKNKTKKRNCLR